jgi:hypothetical protein
LKHEDGHWSIGGYEVFRDIVNGKRIVEVPLKISETKVTEAMNSDAILEVVAPAVGRLEHKTLRPRLSVVATDKRTSNHKNPEKNNRGQDSTKIRVKTCLVDVGGSMCEDFFRIPKSSRRYELSTSLIVRYGGLDRR